MDRRRFIVLGTAGSVAVLTGCGGSSGGGGVATPPTGTPPPPASPPVSNPPPVDARVAADSGAAPDRPGATAEHQCDAERIRRHTRGATCKQDDAAGHVNGVLDVQRAGARTTHRRLRGRHGPHSTGESTVAGDDGALARFAGAARPGRQPHGPDRPGRESHLRVHVARRQRRDLLVPPAPA